MAFACLFTACKKDELLDGSQSVQRATQLEKDLKTQLQSAKNTWVLMLPSLNTNSKTAIPIGLKFDTLTNKVKYKTIYGTDAVDSYFSISASTGMPLLSFSTGSLISSMYEAGGTAITDYFFKVLKVSPDTITIQPYRKGQTYQSEGGVVMKMVKDPTFLADWEKETTKIYTQAIQFFGVESTLRLNYADGTSPVAASVAFFFQPQGNINFFKASYPTVANNKQVEPIEFDYSPNATTQFYPLAMLGYNSLFWETTTRFTPAEIFSTGPNALTAAFKTEYFLIRKVNAKSIDVFALDKNGKEMITGAMTIGK